jgi:hypothetical protein
LSKRLIDMSRMKIVPAIARQISSFSPIIVSLNRTSLKSGTAIPLIAQLQFHRFSIVSAGETYSVSHR